MYCDNQASVEAFRSGRARDRVIGACARALWYVSAAMNVTFRFLHLPGEQNLVADALSRACLSREHKAAAICLIAGLKLNLKTPKPCAFSMVIFSKRVLRLSRSRRKAHRCDGSWNLGVGCGTSISAHPDPSVDDSARSL